MQVEQTHNVTPFAGVWVEIPTLTILITRYSVRHTLRGCVG